MNRAIATLQAGTVGAFILWAGLASVTQAQTPSAADLLSGVQERSIQNTSFSSQRSYGTNEYSQTDADKSAGIKLDQNLQLQVESEREALPIGAYPTDDNAKGNRVQLIYQFDEPTLPIR